MTKYKINKIYLVEFDAEFPSGIAAGAGSLGNQIQLARNGQNELVLRGTSIAGVLRSQMRDSDFAPNENDMIFGMAHGDKNDDNEAGTPSLLKVEDVVLKTDTGELNRVSHLRCRHTGSVAESALYSINTAPPKTRGHFRLWLEVPSDERNPESIRAMSFLQELAGKIYPGIIFGGNSNRGVGRAEVCGKIHYKKYNLFDKDGYAEYLDDSYAIRSGGMVKNWQELEPVQSTQNTLTVEWNFIIPPGEDLLVSDGKGLDAESEPHRITGADGKDYWLLPGSTLRGLFRDWCTRLAAREGKKVVDNLDQFLKEGPASGDDLGWMFQKGLKGDEKSNFLKEIDKDWPIESMFGSLHKRGRLYISDGLSAVGTSDKDESRKRSMSYLAADDLFPVQYRMHVALDAISGAAVDGALFDNFVLTSGGGDYAVRFPVKLILKNPKEEEVRWLAQSLHAIHTGLLRVGSSKSAGRLAVEENSLNVDGNLKDLFISTANLSKNKSEWINLISVDSSAVKKESEETVSKNLSVCTGKMLGSLDLKATYTDGAGKRQTIKIPKEIWGYRAGDAMRGPVVKLTFNGGILVDVEIPGKPKKKGPAPVETIQASVSPAPRRGQQTDTNKLPKGKASLIGMPFYNPYTFVPFAEKSEVRQSFTSQTADETTKDKRFTGILRLDVETLSPLLTSEGWSQQAKDCAKNGIKYNAKDELHKQYQALAIGSDVVLPATGVRGFLRNLLTIISGGPLTVLNEDTYLCQGRDLPISRNNTVAKKPILARVKRPGNSLSDGEIEIGRTEMFSAERWMDSYRPKAGNIQSVWGEYRNGKISSLSFERNENHNVQVKLSGKPVNTRGDKKEGIFWEENLRTITLGPEFWLAYNSRNKFGMRPELKKGDLVWIESVADYVEADAIKGEKDIASIQWARWGRRGVKIGEVMPDFMTPDSHRTDQKVSMVTDMFGQVAYRKEIPGLPLKGRVRPGNLVFEGARQKLMRNLPIAVMGAPHIGCTAFCRKETNPDKVANNGANPLRGYKVYRNEKNLESEPWLYKTQGVYEESGKLKTDLQKVNFTADLLPAKTIGHIDIALRGLSPEEFGLINMACSTLWHLGGGKPLGLGLCRIVRFSFTNEYGELINPEKFQVVKAEWKKQLDYWTKTQQPVENVRYPRATVRNNNKNTRGGMTWFQKMSSIKKGGSVGMEPIYVCGELKEKVRRSGVDNRNHGPDVEMIYGQTLPFFPDNPEKELLYGYDAFFCDKAPRADFEKIERQELRFNNTIQRSCYPAIEKFDENKHITHQEESGENLSTNRDTRNSDKRNRQEENGENLSSDRDTRNSDKRNQDKE